MWIEGKTSGQISETLGGVTRNAVMGMVNRMGLMGNKAHNALIKSAHGACRPIGLDGATETAGADIVAVEPTVVEPRHDPVPEPARDPAPVADAVPAARGANDDPRPDERRARLASRLLGPLRRAMAPAKAPVPAAEPVYVSPEAPTRQDRRERPNWRMAISMVEEVTGQRYSASATGHRTSLVAISSILGGGDPRRILPRDFPEPFVLRTMRNLAEKGIMIGGNTPETWLDPEIGDLNFFIDMLVAEGVMSGSRTSSTPTTLTA